MRLAITLFRYFPFGGLQRDMLAIAQEAVSRGHQVTVFCGEWEGDKPKGIDVVCVNDKNWLQKSSVKKFVSTFEKTFQCNNFDLLLGFNKMPGLDIYFAADSCFAQKAYAERSWLYRLAPRSRCYLQQEKAVFNTHGKTQILSLVDSAERVFAQHYATPPERFHRLPPGISRAQFACDNPPAARKKIRTELQIDEHTKIILCLGSGFKTKGLERSIAAFAQWQAQSTQDACLLVVGAGNAKKYIAQAQRLTIAGKVIFLGGRNDVADILQAADALLHSAYSELAGNVILETMLAAKPVVVTDVCGFAHYVAEHNMGRVIAAPYETNAVASALAEVLEVSPEYWKINAEKFSTTEDVFSRQAKAVDILEAMAGAALSESLEWISDTKDFTVVLQDELVAAWSQEDIFSVVTHLSGAVARESSNRQTLGFELNGHAYYRKLHSGVGWGEILKNLVRFCWPVLGAKNEWLALRKLRALGIPSLDAVAFGEQKTNPAKKVSFIVTRALADVVQLDNYFQQQVVGFAAKKCLIEKVAVIARNMHAAGINHRDFYLCHFMLNINSIRNWRKEGDALTLFIVDLHRAQIRHQVPYRWLVKDLGALFFSSFDMKFTQRDYLRFMRVYWQAPLVATLHNNKGLLAAIEHRAAKIYARDLGVPPMFLFANKVYR